MVMVIEMMLANNGDSGWFWGSCHSALSTLSRLTSADVRDSNQTHHSNHEHTDDDKDADGDDDDDDDDDDTVAAATTSSSTSTLTTRTTIFT